MVSTLHRRLVMRLTIVVVTLFAAVLPLVASSATADAMSPAIVINEFVAENNNGLADNTGSFEDWIELHNTTTSSISLTGWTIADGDGTTTFADVDVPAGGYRVLIASGDVSRSTSSELHLPFKLSADGEPLTLRDASGVVSEPNFAAPGFPALPSDVSYGLTGTGTLAYFTTPTPGSANNNASTGIVAPVTFSIPHGFYAATQTVVLDSPTTGATIRYTLDNSTPTTSLGTALSPGQSITVSGTTSVRAIAYRSGWIPSTTETRTYFFSSDITNQSESTPAGWPNNGSVNNAAFDYGMDGSVASQSAIEASLTSIPSISIVTDQANLTDASTGIYVNPLSSGMNWERPASVELIDPNGAEPGFEINAGLRIRGGGSRRPDNPKHSLRLYFRDDYGDGDLEYPLFGIDGVDTFESLGLATGQNGSWSHRGEESATWIREMWSRETQRAMGQPTTDSRFYHLYLNGQYWGLYYSQERLSGGFGAAHFGGNKDDYDVVGATWRGAGTASDGTVDGLKALWPIVSDLSVTNAEYATLDAQVDIDNLADYYLLHYFSGDFDGSPMGWTGGGGQWSDSNNWRAFRNRTGLGDAGKWLFFDHDSEIAMCAMSSTPTVDNTTPWSLQSGSVPNHQVVTPAWLHESLLTHPTYRQIFRDKVAQHMQTAGGALTPAVSQARVDELRSQVAGAIDAEAARWGDSLGDPAHDKGDWEINVAALRECAASRFDVVQGQLQVDGLWPSNNPPVVLPAGGAVPYGTDVTIAANGEPGTIWYTTNGADPRSATGAVSPTAIAYSGPFQIVAASGVRARVLSAGTWTPLVAVDYTLSTPAGPVTLLLNEFNAVGASKFLGGGAAGDTANGSDATFGRVAGNGGDWFELAVLEDIDITGWTFEIWHLDNGFLELSAALQVVADAPDITPLAAGTIITISEGIADDSSWDPTVGDWHINLQANAADQGQYFTAISQQNFAIDNDDTQIAIFDATGAPVMLRTGEGTVPGVSINSEEVFKLEASAATSVRFDSPFYADGTSSTWGLPNLWGAGTVTQDFDPFRVLVGDVTCDRQLNVADALVIAQYSVGTRIASTSCPINPVTEAFAPAADANKNGTVNVADALLVAQCSVGLSNVACPN